MKTICRRISLRETQDIITMKVIFGGTESKHTPYVVHAVRHKQSFI